MDERRLVLLSALTQINGGSILIAATLVALAVGLYRLSPVGSQTVQTLKDLLDAQKAELHIAREQRDSALEAIDLAKDEIAGYREQIAVLSQRPDTTVLAQAISDMNAANAAHRSDLAEVLEKLAASSQKLEEGMASNTQALMLLVDRHRHERKGDQ
jgi:hypothetical protein